MMFVDILYVFIYAHVQIILCVKQCLGVSETCTMK